VWITIQREERRNALNLEVIARLHALFEDAARDPRLRAVVLSGAGRKAFCAGADLAGGTGVFAAAIDEPTTDFGRLARVVRGLGVPVIGRINGDCVAGGMGLMALCDLVVSCDTARFGLPEAKVGVFPMQVLVYLRRMIHPRHVNELCLSGELIDAWRAREWGIANEVVPYEQLDASVQAWVERLARLSAVAVRRGKHAIAAMESMAFEQALPFAEAQIAIASRTDDAREGLAAFNDKRAPHWAAGSGEP
jgi:enoyl-CoA hydratase/carnithine racemase